MTMTISMPRQWFCKICGSTRDYQTKERLVAHIKKTDRLSFVNAKNLDEWNIPIDQVEAKLANINSSASNSSDEPLDLDKRTIDVDKRTIDVDKHTIDVDKRTIDVDKRTIDVDKRRALLKRVHVDRRTIPQATHELHSPKDTAEDSGFDSDDTTLDRYIEYICEETTDTIENIDFHAKRLSKCVAILTSGGYLVKFLSPEGKVVYAQMCKKSLTSLLETLTIEVIADARGGRREISLANLLNKPRVCMRLSKFRCADFFSDDPKVFNLWRGFHYDPAESFDHSPGSRDMALIQPMLGHIRKVICSKDPDVYEHELKKLGWIFQNLNEHLGYATVLLSDEGTGKGTYLDFICDLFGPDWSEPNITNMEMITETNHAEAIAYKKVIVANEIKELDHNRASWEVMKSRITDDFYRVRLIYCASKIVRNVNIYYLCTNNIFSIKMGQCDRRYEIIRVSEKHLQDTDYFERLRASLTIEMKRYFIRFLLDMDTAGFNPRLPPMTSTKKDIQEAQIPLVQEFLYRYDWKTSLGEYAGDLGEDGKPIGVTFKELYKDGFLNFCDEYGVPEKYRAGIGKFGLEIQEYGVEKRTAKIDGKSTRIYSPKPDEEAKPKKSSEEVKIGDKTFKKGTSTKKPAKKPESDEIQSFKTPESDEIQSFKIAGRVRKSAQPPPPVSQSSPGSEPAESPPQ
jgi:hypothetical protein